MRIHVASASASVTRALEAIVSAAGHIATPLAEAELLVRDPLHPLPDLPEPTIPQMTLDIATLAHPIRPYRLLQLLLARLATPTFPLGHGWELDTLARSITHPDHPALSLTEKESSLLATLAAAHPTAIDREALLADIWGMRAEIDTHTLETHIYRLRHKLGECTHRPCDIVTEGGAYRLVEVPA